MDEEDINFNWNIGNNSSSIGVHERKNIAQFKETLIDVIDHLPLSVQLNTAQRDALLTPLDKFVDQIYMMNPVAVVAGYVATVISRRYQDGQNASGALKREHIQEVMDIFRSRLNNKELSPYDIVKYALAYNKLYSPKVRANIEPAGTSTAPDGGSRSRTRSPDLLRGRVLA